MKYIQRNDIKKKTTWLYWNVNTLLWDAKLKKGFIPTTGNYQVYKQHSEGSKYNIQKMQRLDFTFSNFKKVNLNQNIQNQGCH